MERLTSLPDGFRFDGPRIIDGKVCALIRPHKIPIGGSLVDLWDVLGVYLHKDELSAESQQKWIDVWAELEYHDAKKLINMLNEDNGYAPLTDEEKNALLKERQEIVVNRIQQKRDQLKQETDENSDGEIA